MDIKIKSDSFLGILAPSGTSKSSGKSGLVVISPSANCLCGFCLCFSFSIWFNAPQPCQLPSVERNRDTETVLAVICALPKNCKNPGREIALIPDLEGEVLRLSFWVNLFRLFSVLYNKNEMPSSVLAIDQHHLLCLKAVEHL